MKEICEKLNCTGCRLCENSCPMGAIEMAQDEKGFIRPKINEKKCINCNLCANVCPQNSVSAFNYPIKIYACKNKSETERISSSSGGTFEEIAKAIFKNNGIVYGAIFNKDFKVQHDKAENMAELDKIRRSKYVQSDMNDIYKDIDKSLKDGRQVLFSGSPCQVNAVKNYKQIDNDKIFYVDIVCHGVPSPKIFEEYKLYLEEKFNSKIVNINFRYKNEITTQNIKVDFENGETYIANCRDKDLFYALFLKDTILRDCCYNCKYKNFERIGDISLADFWGYERGPAKDFGDKKGVSLVLVNTKKGMEMFEKIKGSLDVFEVQKEDCYEYNCFKNFETPKLRDEFWKNYYKLGFDVDFIKKFIEKII